MTDTPEEKYESMKHSIWGDPDDFERGGLVEKGEMTERDAELIQELCDAFDGNKLERTQHKKKKEDFERSKQKNKAKSTLWGWMYRLSRIARQQELTEMTADDINDLMEHGFHEGNVDGCNGMKKSTIRTYQFAVRIFYRYHSDLGVDPQHIAIYEDDGDAIDPDDMLTRDEIDRLTQACDHPRDQMLFHLLLYTGLRSNAARNLKIKDIDLDDGTYQLPDVEEGLKGADDRNGDRPLLLAEGSIRKWLGYHPESDDPDAYLITGKPRYGKAHPHDTVGHNCLRYTMNRLKERAEVDKPLHPHALRHNFVTICKRDYDLHNDTIKYLIGHTKDSRVMETTYSHLSGDDYVQEAREKAGLAEPEDRDTFTPKKCTNCGTKVDPGSKACFNCGAAFTPDAAQTRDKVDQSIYDGKAEAAREGNDEVEQGVDSAKKLIENDPELAAEVVEELMSDD